MAGDTSASRPFTAAFDSTCAECGGEIVGNVDEIVMFDGEALHEDCAPKLKKPVTFPI